MGPILTLPYSEWVVAEQLMRVLPAKEGYSVFAPLSRQEKGVDLLLTRRVRGTTRTAALQVKYSRVWEMRSGAKFHFGSWFQAFPVSDRADFYVLVSLYPHITGRGVGSRSSWWLPLLILLTRKEMVRLLSSLKTRSGRADRMFYFGFDGPDRIALTRGTPEPRDFTAFSLTKRWRLLRQHVSPA